MVLLEDNEASKETIHGIEVAVFDEVDEEVVVVEEDINFADLFYWLIKKNSFCI